MVVIVRNLNNVNMRNIVKVIVYVISINEYYLEFV